ncbi:MAG: ABC transporter substrate-binding protein, partial [Oscillospiraceae bacterium]|nr:ABC transporter substrate-binding protein [Oscillospiraceae bacterium]
AVTEAPAAAEEPAGPTVFTDSCGREVELPAEIARIAPSGIVATMILAAIAPDLMCCTGARIEADQAAYLYPGLTDLEFTGQLYGGKSTLNLEQLLATEADVIIDLGDFKKTIAEDLDALQEQTGLPCIFLEADLPHMADAFRTLGALLGREERGEELAALVEETLAMAERNSAAIPESDRVTVLYSSGPNPLGTDAEGSSQAQVLGLVGAVNAVVVEDVTSKGGGNIINMEQLYNFDPDVVIVAEDDALDQVLTDDAWAELRAVREGRVYRVPTEPYCWLSAPPSMNMLLGVWYLGNLLYPEIYDYDMAEKAQEIYQTLWRYELTPEEAAAMLSAVPAA